MLIWTRLPQAATVPTSPDLAAGHNISFLGVRRSGPRHVQDAALHGIPFLQQGHLTCPEPLFSLGAELGPCVGPFGLLPQNSTVQAAHKQQTFNFHSPEAASP